MKMFIKDLDYISPPITLYQNRLLSHSSLFSGILSCLAFIFIAIYCYFFSIDFINHKNPNSYYYNSFIEDAGFFPINSSSIFHFLSIKDVGRQSYELGFDFQMFRVIGIVRQFEAYYLRNDLKNMDHWLYGKCNNDSDTKGINYLIDKDFFNESACIRKYYNKNEGKYYDTNEPNFKWPNISKGNFNANQTFYSVIVEKCQEDTLQLILGHNFHCKNETEIEEYFLRTHNFHFNFIDEYIDLLNFREPSKKFLYKIDTPIDKDKYNVNHLNFNPTILKTHKGFIFEENEEALSFIYDRNDVVINSNLIGKKIYMVYRLWLNNKLYNYERFYKKFPDVFADIGGIAEFINYIAMIINFLYNNYIIIDDTQKLFDTFNYNSYEKKIKSRNNLIHNRIKNNNCPTNSKKNNIIVHKSKKTKLDISNNNKENIERSQLKSHSSNAIISFNNFKKHKTKRSDFNKNKINGVVKRPELYNRVINIKKININFFYYLTYKLFFRKKYRNIKAYEEFREKIISEEQLFKNYFYINQLKKIKGEINISNDNNNEKKSINNILS